MNAALEIRARRRWTAFIAMFFVAQAGLWTWAIATVSSDPSHAIVANYDARALDWDAQRAREQASAALQWQTQIDLGGTQVTIRLADREGQPVEAEAVSVAIFHKAEAAHRQAVTLHATAPGVWIGPARLHRDGRWIVELEATRGDDRFSITRTVVME